MKTPDDLEVYLEVYLVVMICTAYSIYVYFDSVMTIVAVEMGR